MKWINHKATALCVSYLFTADPVFSGLAMGAAIMPDAVEGRFLFRRHRGWSHSPVFWFLALAVAYAVSYLCANIIAGNMLKTTMNPRFIIFVTIMYATILHAMMFGVAWHLATDSLSASGIPIWGNRRLAFGVYVTHQPREYMLSAAICVVCIAAAWAVGRTPQYDTIRILMP